MWWPTQARSPRARQNVAFCSAPQASSGRRAAIGSVSDSGTYPRERRSISGRGEAPSVTVRVTESSVRVSISRSWTRNTSAMPASRARASSSR